MHYCIYLPNVLGARESLLEDAGLSALCGESAAFARAVGPDGTIGVCVSWDDLGALDCKDPDYEWIDSEEGWWLGVNRKSPPTPQDLLRKGEMESGYDLTLDDGQVWMVAPASAVEQTMKARSDGELVWEPIDRDRQYAINAQQIATTIFERLDVNDLSERVESAKLGDLCEEPVAFEIKGAYEHAALGLSVKYRVTPEICSMLGILSTAETVEQIVCCSIDLPDIQVTREQKKSWDGSGSRVVIDVG